jgi:hypothetical protein
MPQSTIMPMLLLAMLPAATSVAAHEAPAMQLPLLYQKL